MNKEKELIDEFQEYLDLGFKNMDICLYDDDVLMIIEVLEKQVAKKVIIPSTDLGKYYHQESCPNCKKEFSVRIAGYKFKDVIGETNYCHNCGQKLDWSEVE